MVPRGVGTFSGLAAAAIAMATAAIAAPSLDVAMGQRLFERNWVSAPSSTKYDDGLGPLYDATSCSACHVLTPKTQADEESLPPGLVIRLGNARGETDPVYGAQLQTKGVAGQVPEASPEIGWGEKDGLRIVTVKPGKLGYGPLAPDTRMSLRRAPSLKGIGLLARVPDHEILKNADSEDANHDGIAGRAAWVIVDGKRRLGRFGWKSASPDLPSQIAAALSRDIGISTNLRPEPWGDCTAAQRACRAGPHGAAKGDPEIPEALLDLVVAYVGSLSAPPPPKDTLGQKLFADAGCSACHLTLHLADGTPVRAYTDLLLHDMGAGLGDGIEEGAGEPWFWRTAPLWDVATTLKLGGLLHDGRARNVAEAVQWHDGEAASARAHFRALSPSDKAALVTFVSGL
jgi:CxxC motif-containing protein (DUF1111 family)